MQDIAEQFLLDVEKETVDFTSNYDGSLLEPVILPTNIPNLLISGSSGIAVGMATNIPPHNLKEVVDAIIHTIDNPEITFKRTYDRCAGSRFSNIRLYSWKKRHSRGPIPPEEAL